MAFGRMKNKQRSSSSNSYVSTTTILVFIALCVLGAWMLTSDSIISRQSTTHGTFTRTRLDASTDMVEPDLVPPIVHSAGKTNSGQFEGNPGDFPDDLGKDDQPEKSQEDEKLDQESTEDKKSNAEALDQQALISKDEMQENRPETDEIDVKMKKDQSSDDVGTKDYVKESNVGDSEEQTAERKDDMQGNGHGKNDSNNKEREREPQVDEDDQGSGGKEPVEKQVSKERENEPQVDEDDQGSGGKEPVEKQVSKERENEPQVDEDDGSGGKEPVEKQVSKERENEPQVDEDDEGSGGKEPVEKQVSKESTTDQKEDVQESRTDESTTFDAQKSNPENDQSSKPQYQVEESKDEDKGPRNPNDPKSDEEERQKDENQKQTEEEHQEEHQKEDDKPVTFSDVTQKDTSVQDTRDDINTKLEKDENDKQNKPLVQKQQEEESSKQVDSQEERDPTEVNKQDTKASTIEDKPAEMNPLLNAAIPKESNESKTSWATQAAQSHKEKQRREGNMQGEDEESLYGYTWRLCNVTSGPDYIPCLDNENALRRLRSFKHFEHRERHCPEDPPTCLVPLPEGYKRPIQWPESRDKIWFHNVPHTELAKVKGHQNWVKVTGEFLTFPGGGTQFIRGALSYIEFIERISPGIKLGKHTRVILDVGCGVASFGGYLFDRDVLTMSFAPKDEHEAQVQFALERGIPAISAVMGSQRLPYPSGVFDVVHCARCRVPWHAEGGRLLLELNRVMRPGGCFIWSATPVYQELQEDVEIWEAMTALTASMCWKLEKKEKDALNKIGVAIYRKPLDNECYEQRQENSPPMCKPDDDPNAAWYVPLQSCLHRVPTDKSARGSKWPLRWPKRLRVPPYWLNETQMGIYGKPAPHDFVTDYKHWQRVVNKSYLNALGISWSDVRNVMDMRAVYGGFAAALRDLKVWVMNVVNVNSPDTLPIIYERGLFGIYHDWCESFSTYPRTYDLLHADHLFSKLKERCQLAPVMAEVDRIVRPGGKFIARDDSSTIEEVENLLKSLHWEVHLTFSKDQEGILSATKSDWRPKLYAIP